jgi:hypothetical protein
MIMVTVLTWMGQVLILIVAGMVLIRQWRRSIVFAAWAAAASTTCCCYVFTLIGSLFKFQFAAFAHMMAHYQVLLVTLHEKSSPCS